MTRRFGQEEHVAAIDPQPGLTGFPAASSWPGLVSPGTEINEIFSAEDWATTLVAAAGEPAVKEKLLTGYEADGKTFKVHLDRYDQGDLLAGHGPDKRREFFYWTDDGDLAG